jgi:ketosteroid isomerase-like protein
MSRAVVLLASAWLCVGSLAAAQAPAEHPKVDLPPEVDRVLRDYEHAWTSRDAAALAALFTEDGFVLSNAAPPVRGRAAIREAYAKAGGPLNLRAIGFSTEGSVAYVIGMYSHGEGSPENGKFVLALRRDGGRWWIAADMDNSNRPPPRPSPPPAPATK